jgi:hypothetical protein
MWIDEVPEFNEQEDGGHNEVRASVSVWMW